MTNPERRNSPRFLPEVTQPAVEAAARNVQQYGWSTFRANTIFTLQHSNQYLLIGIQGFLERTRFGSTEPRKEAAIAAMIATHEMLAEQAKIDTGDGAGSPYRLPVVQPEIVSAFQADILERGAMAVGMDTIDKLERDNAHLQTSVGLFLVGAGVNGPPLSSGYATMQMTYALLARQGEADYLNKML